MFRRLHGPPQGRGLAFREVARAANGSPVPGALLRLRHVRHVTQVNDVLTVSKSQRLLASRLQQRVV